MFRPAVTAWRGLPKVEMILLSPQPVFFSFLSFSCLCSLCGSSLESPPVLERPAFSLDCLVWSDPMLRRKKHSVSHSISERLPPPTPPQSSCEGSRCIRQQLFLQSCPAPQVEACSSFFSRQSTGHAAAANHALSLIWYQCNTANCTVGCHTTGAVSCNCVNYDCAQRLRSLPGFCRTDKRKGPIYEKAFTGSALLLSSKIDDFLRQWSFFKKPGSAYCDIVNINRFDDYTCCSLNHPRARQWLSWLMWEIRWL